MDLHETFQQPAFFLKSIFSIWMIFDGKKKSRHSGCQCKIIIGMDKNYLLGNPRLLFYRNYEGAHTHTYLCMNILKFHLHGTSVVQLNDILEFKVSNDSFIIFLFILKCWLQDCSSTDIAPVVSFYQQPY